jgi:hypothetical protein
MIIDLSQLALDRLRANPEVRAHFRHLGGAADLAVAQMALKTRPAGFVLALAEVAAAPLVAGEFRQRKILQIGIVIADADAGDSTGEGARTGIMSSRTLVERALVGVDGWLPEGCAEALAWSGGRLAQITQNGLVWWQDEYVTSQLVAT